MTSLRASLATASLLLLSASTLPAQGARIACKDGSQPKVGHFTCWGHGGVVSAPAKKSRALEKKPVAKKKVTGKKAAAKARKSRTTKHGTK